LQHAIFSFYPAINLVAIQKISYLLRNVPVKLTALNMDTLPVLLYERNQRLEIKRIVLSEEKALGGYSVCAVRGSPLIYYIEIAYYSPAAEPHIFYYHRFFTVF